MLKTSFFPFSLHFDEIPKKLLKFQRKFAFLIDFDQHLGPSTQMHVKIHNIYPHFELVEKQGLNLKIFKLIKLGESQYTRTVVPNLLSQKSSLFITLFKEAR